MRELVDAILMINEEVKVKIPKINQGGCGIFAIKMAKELKKLGYSPNIVIIDRGVENVNNKKEILNRVTNKERVGSYEKRQTSFCHCCVEIGGLYFDGLHIGLSLMERWNSYIFSGNYTIEEMEIALKVGGWNSSYDRRKNRMLQGIIDKSIKYTFKQNLKTVQL